MSVFFEQYNVVSSLGNSLSETWEALAQNKSGISDLKKLKIVADDFSVTAGAPYNLPALPSVHDNNIADEYKAVVKTLFNGLRPSPLPVDALILASNVSSTEQHLSIQPFNQKILLEYIHDEMISHGLKPAAEMETLCLYNTCISGLSALSLASDFLSSGMKKQVLIIAIEPRLRQWSLMPLDFLNMLSRNENVERSSIPFSIDRSGFVKGDGAAIALLGAGKTQNSIELLSVGEVNDCYRLTDPDENGRGLEESILMALKKAKVHSTEVDSVYAHATSTVKYDKIEAQVLKRIFQANRAMTISALKSQLGHTNISSSLISTIVAAESLVKNSALPVLKLKEDSLIESLNYVKQVCPNKARTALINASGIGGYNASALIRKT